MYGLFSTMEWTHKKGAIIFFRNKLRLKEKRTVNDIMQNHYDDVYQQNDSGYYHPQQHEEKLQQEYERRVKEEVVGRYFITLYARKNIRRVHSVDFKLKLDDKFWNKKEGQEMSFRYYYRKVYDIDLRQVFAGMVVVKNRNGRIDYYPPEICYLTGYPDKLREDKKITGIIARKTSIPLAERTDNFYRIIEKLRHYNKFNNRENMISGDASIVGHKKSLKYGERLIQCKAHRLQPVTILYHSVSNRGITAVRDDQFLRNSKDIGPFNDDETGDYYHFVNCAVAYFVHAPRTEHERPHSDESCFEKINNAFKYFLNEWYPESQNQKGVTVSPFLLPIEIRSPRPEHDDNNMKRFLRNMLKYLEEAIINKKLGGIFFVLPSICGRNDKQTNKIYNTVKAFCNLKTGTISQCIKASTICPDMFGNNRGRGNQHKVQQALKSAFRQFMIKLGVIPWKIQLKILDDNDNDRYNRCNPTLNYLPDNAINLNKPTMIIGIDVNHNRKKGVSTIGYTSTYDSDFCRVVVQVDHQRMGQEILGIDTLQQSTENAILYFKEINTVYPQQIFVYRDGVSLGELEKVSMKELNAIERAAERVSIDCPNPDIQFMVVQKRVNARFFEMDNRYNYKSLIGAKPPVIIDRDIVSPNMWDFYLIACNAPKDKVANPVRVIIINDGLKLAQKNSKNDLELFTYSLCNLYYGWCGAVKIPHVIKYADKVAEMYSNTYNYVDIVGATCNKPNIPSHINLTHHYL